jgi:transposase
MYLHLYYSAERALEHEKALNKLLQRLQESGKRNTDHEKLYATYFEVIHTPVRGIRVAAKEKAIAEAKKNYGYFALLSNDIKNPIEALEIYRNKDLIEKSFGNLKERLNLRRLSVSSEQSLDGKLFVEFLALIILSYIKKRMQSTGLFKTTTMQGLLDELDIIEGFEQPGHKPYVGEMTNRQIELYEKMGVKPPPSLQ